MAGCAQDVEPSRSYWSARRVLSVDARRRETAMAWDEESLLDRPAKV